jgi:hypothetical protein
VSVGSTAGSPEVGQQHMLDREVGVEVRHEERLQPRAPRVGRVRQDSGRVVAADQRLDRVIAMGAAGRRRDLARTSPARSDVGSAERRARRSRAAARRHATSRRPRARALDRTGGSSASSVQCDRCGGDLARSATMDP